MYRFRLLFSARERRKHLLVKPSTTARLNDSRQHHTLDAALRPATSLTSTFTQLPPRASKRHPIEQAPSSNVDDVTAPQQVVGAAATTQRRRQRSQLTTSTGSHIATLNHIHARRSGCVLSYIFICTWFCFNKNNYYARQERYNSKQNTRNIVNRNYVNFVVGVVDRDID